MFCLVCFYRSTGELSYALKGKDGRRGKTERERQKRDARMQGRRGAEGRGNQGME